MRGIVRKFATCIRRAIELAQQLKWIATRRVRKQYTDEVRAAGMRNLHIASAPCPIYEIRSASSRGGVGSSPHLEVVTASAVTDVELVPDEREQHGMRAVEQLAVFNRLEVQFRQDVRRAPSIPAETVPGFRRKAGRVAHDWEYTMGALQ
jgi:hypothetical protein